MANEDRLSLTELADIERLAQEGLHGGLLEQAWSRRALALVREVRPDARAEGIRRREGLRRVTGTGSRRLVGRGLLRLLAIQLESQEIIEVEQANRRVCCERLCL